MLGTVLILTRQRRTVCELHFIFIMEAEARIKQLEHRCWRLEEEVKSWCACANRLLEEINAKEAAFADMIRKHEQDKAHTFAKKVRCNPNTLL